MDGSRDWTIETPCLALQDALESLPTPQSQGARNCKANVCKTQGQEGKVGWPVVILFGRLQGDVFSNFPTTRRWCMLKVISACNQVRARSHHWPFWPIRVISFGFEFWGFLFTNLSKQEVPLSSQGMPNPTPNRGSSPFRPNRTSLGRGAL